ncbi:MAG: FixH family protein [Hyphomicrobiales bacterium]|nr:FixH family protein [Hyphomicrobiales bacterium]
MSRRVLIALAAVVIVAIVGWQLAIRAFVAAPDELDLSLSKKSATGLYSVSLTPEQAPSREGALQSFILTVKMADGTPVDVLRIAVGGGMPRHGHGLPVEPRVGAALGNGKYRIEGVKFSMAGWWQLKFTIDAPPGRDDVEFNIVL